MKAILFFILFISFLIIYSSENIIYELSKYGKVIYSNTNTSYSLLDITGIKEEQLEIIYTIHKNHNYDEYNILYYSFTNIYPNDTKCEVEKSINGIINDSFEKEIKITFNIKKEEGKYLLLLNIKCNDDESIEVEHIKKEKEPNPKPKENGDGKDNKDNKGLILIIIMSIIVVAGIIIGFIILGKFIYNKRQQEVMGSYASSFVEENPGLVPNNEQKENTNDDNNPK